LTSCKIIEEVEEEISNEDALENDEVSTSLLEINPKELLDILENQTSFRCQIMENEEYILDIIWVIDPTAFYIKTFEDGVVLAHFIEIEQREWLGPGTDPDDWLPVNSLASDLKESAKELRDSALQLLNGTLQAAFPDRKVKSNQDSVEINGVVCNEYSWIDNDNKQELYVAVDNGLPVMAKMNSLKINIIDINNPANVIKAPVSEFPEKLYVDDARMF